MTRKTILVVDDDAPTRKAYVEFLTDCGYNVLEAAHGGEAIMHVYRHRPDLVLMDITMPVLDGLETAQSLRERSSTANLRILAVTGSQSALKKERMLELCDDVLMKPCAPEVVASRIRTLVQKAA